MIYSAISTISQVINDYIRNRFATVEDKVVVSNLVNPDGSVAVTEPDKIILSLINLQQETVSQRGKGGTNRPVNLNIFILFSASFEAENYLEGLRYLSGVISFFQSNKILNHSNTPDMDSEIDKLSFEIVNQDLQNLSHLWGTVGSKYMPSILYKVRMITFNESFTNDLNAPFTGFGTN
ncbi:hypothetical protein GCM10011506_35610 [Marivirga lumbricoides]|uniref:Pvc16 N-terminal domain-containing protein n=1 Tax=Marivirga lumbricoides TaxID=1046115 RepID=A0ABQ1MXI3_9BACT|nr:hypothetical protein GCM10011506_35610 [Marivirga lumbricoides]